MWWRLKGFGASESGAVAPIVAVSLFALIAAAGLAFDYARLVGMDTELQNAADQAALAAASQLDGQTGACSRASAAAVGLIANSTYFSNVGGTPAITVTAQPSCTVQNGSIRFYKDKAGTTFATGDSDANFVDVTVGARRAQYALTAVVGALNSGDVAATARAGLGGAVCKVPPMMICNPLGDGVTVDWNSYKGRGVQVVASNGNTWTPGNFGFLNVGQTNNGAPDLKAALAYQDAALSCQSTTAGEVDPGLSGAIDAINTRFGIYNFSSGSGTTLGACWSGSCPAAADVTKDLVTVAAPTGNDCGLANGNGPGWKLPSNPFIPRAQVAGDTFTTSDYYNAAGATLDSMGLPRDLCHYTDYGQTCPYASGRVGDGNWARGDYFRKYHSGSIPAGASSWTRYETYAWEIANSNMPGIVSAGAGYQHGVPTYCSAGTRDPNRDRRVLTVAVAQNCGSLSGSSTAVDIGDWIDVFFVEPAFNRGHGAGANDIYMEVIGKSKSSGGNGETAQTVYRSVPYLVR